mgnify:CR=1 FL=1
MSSMQFLAIDQEPERAEEKEMYKTYYVKTEKLIVNENVLLSPITLLDGNNNEYI